MQTTASIIRQLAKERRAMLTREAARDVNYYKTNRAKHIEGQIHGFELALLRIGRGKQ